MGIPLRAPGCTADVMTTESAPLTQPRSNVAAGAAGSIVANRGRADGSESSLPSSSLVHAGDSSSVPFFRKMLPRWNVGSGWQYLSTTPSEKLLLLPPSPTSRSPATGVMPAIGIVSRSVPVAPSYTAESGASPLQPLPPWGHPSSSSSSTPPQPSHKDEWLQALRGFFTRSQPSRQAIGRRSPVAQPRNHSSREGGASSDVELKAGPFPRDHSVPRQHSADIERLRGPTCGNARSGPSEWQQQRSASCEQASSNSSSAVYHAMPCQALDVLPTSPRPQDGSSAAIAVGVQRRPSPRYARLQNEDHRRSDAAPAACRRNNSRRATVDCTTTEPRQRQSGHVAIPDVSSLPDFKQLPSGTGCSSRLTASEAGSSASSVFTIATTDDDEDTGDNDSASGGCGSACSSGAGRGEPDTGLGFYDEWSSSLRRFATLRRTTHQQEPRSQPSTPDQMPSTAAPTSSPAQTSRWAEVGGPMLLPWELAGSAAALGAMQQQRSNSYSSSTMEPPAEARPRTDSVGQGQRQRSRTPRLFRRGLQMLTERARNSFRSSSRRNTEKQEMSRKIKTAHSYESLLAGGPTVPSSDVREGRAQVQPLHASILGQENCFQIVTTSGSTFYACRGAEERDRWIACLRKTINPHEDSSRRVDVSLKLWVQEAKNCQSKKRYFCEISLDKTVYARTSTKAKGDMLFWGEQFEFENLPTLSTVTLTLFKETSDKRTRLRQVWAGSSAAGERGAVAIGCVTIGVSELLNRQVSEQWYSVSQLPTSSSGSRLSRDTKTSSGTSGATASSATTAGESTPQIRVKARYQAVQVLPLALYNDLSQYVQHNYLTLVAELEPVLPVRAKDDVATVLVNILHHEGKATAFLCDIVMADVLKQENSYVVFRGNTIATKAIEAYMKLVSGRYLRSTLGECVRTVLEAGDDCEVDPSKLHGSGSTSGGTVSQSVLTKHQASLVKYCEQVWAKIAGSLAQFPSELRDVFAAFRGRCRDLGKADLADNLISACVFLRLLCPAIMSPSLFGLCQEFPDERASRTLTLVAKTIQSLANFTKFGAKEDYMLHMNDFVDREWAHMHEYLQKISSIDSKYRRVDYEGRVDVAKQLSLLHSLLVEEAKADDCGTPSAVAAGTDKSAVTTGGSSPSEMRRRLQPVLQRLTDEVLHGGEGFTSALPPPPPQAGNCGGSSASAADCGSRSHGQDKAAASGAGPHGSERPVTTNRSRPLSAGDHAGVGAKDGCAPLPPAGEIRVLAGAARARDAAAAPAEPVQRTGGVRQATTAALTPQHQQAAGERHALTEPRSRSTRRPTADADGIAYSSSGDGSNPVDRAGQQPAAAVSVGSSKHELASDSAYDTLRSVGSQSDVLPSSGGGGCGSGSGSRLEDSLCSAGGSSSGGNSSLASTKKMVLHKVWDRVLTANDLITGDYVDLISYVDDARGSPSDGGGSVGTITTTSTTAASLLCGNNHAIANREGSVTSDGGASSASSLGSSDTLSRKGTSGAAASATTPVRQAPLTFFNPAFRAGHGVLHTSAVPEPAATSLPLSRSYPGHVGLEPVEATATSDSTGSSKTAVPARPTHWHAPDRFGSLSVRSKLDTPATGSTATAAPAVAASLAQKMPLALHASLGATPTVSVTASSSSASAGQVPVPMARRTVSNGGGCSIPSGGSGFGRHDAGAAAAAPREQLPGTELYAAVNGRAAFSSTSVPTRLAAGSAADVYQTHSATPSPVDVGSSSSRRDALPGESSTWSKGMSSGQGAYREERLAGSVGSGAHHQSHLDVHGRGGSQAGSASISADGSRTLPVPKRSGVAADGAAERESVEFLKQQVEEAQRRLADTEQRLAQQAEQTDRTIHEWRQRLEASEESLRMQARVKDEQIEGIVQRLMAIEEELRREQREMKDALSQRQRLVELQERKIRQLDETNHGLVDSLHALREHVTGQSPSPPLLRARSADMRPSPGPDVPHDDSSVPVPATAATTARTYKTTIFYSKAGNGAGTDS